MSTSVAWQERENIWMVGVFSHATLFPMNHSHDNYNKSNGDQRCLLRTLQPTLSFSMQTFGWSYQHDVLSDSQLYAFSHALFLFSLSFPRAWKMLWINVRYFLEGRKETQNILLSPLWITDTVHFVAVSIYKQKKGALVSIWFHIFCIQFVAPKLEKALS